jgi:exosortase/archaeosortase family protein
MIRFCLLFLAFIFAFALLTSTRAAERFLHEPLSRIVAALCGLVLSLLGSASVSRSYVTFNGFNAEIVEACNGVLPTYIYLAAVLAFPSRWRDKSWGVLIGIPLIFLINLVRVITLMLLGAYRPQAFEGVHIYVWQALVVALSMAVWVFWAERFARPRFPADP